MVGYPEWGVERLQPDEVDAWARAWFTRENAVLWVAGARIPPDLRLALPTGSRRPPPAPTSALDATPAWFAQGDGEVVLDAVVPRSAAASAFGTVLGRELFRTLRQEGGYSYATGANYEPRDDRFATLTAYADAAPDKEDAVLGGLIDVVTAMRAGRIDEAAVSAARARAADRFAEPDVDAQRLSSYAGDLLLGGRAETLDELREEAAAVDVADVHAVAVEAYRTALLKVPEGRTADWAGFAPAPTFSGTRWRAGLRTPDGPVTVRFDECAARLHWPDGRRVLIGLDGISITVEPTLFALDLQARAAIDARVDPDLVITRPARDPTTIPAPERAMAVAGADTPPVNRAFLVVCVAITVLMFASAISATADSLKDAGAPDSDWGTTAILWLLVLVPGAPTARMLRRYRAARRSGDQQ